MKAPAVEAGRGAGCRRLPVARGMRTAMATAAPCAAVAAPVPPQMLRQLAGVVVVGLADAVDGAVAPVRAGVGGLVRAAVAELGRAVPGVSRGGVLGEHGAAERRAGRFGSGVGGGGRHLLAQAAAAGQRAVVAGVAVVGRPLAAPGPVQLQVPAQRERLFFLFRFSLLLLWVVAVGSAMTAAV